MPQMYPMSWLFIYTVVFLVLVLVSLVISFEFEGGGLESGVSENDSVGFGMSWLW